MLYAVGIVELELESTSALVLLMFVIPLAFTLSGFLLWILYSLNGKSIFQDEQRQLTLRVKPQLPNSERANSDTSLACLPSYIAS